MERQTDVMIIDTDANRSRSLRRILARARKGLRIQEVHEVKGCRDAILSRRPTLVLLHSTFPYIEEDGTGLMELIQDDFRNTRTGVMLVLPIPSTLVYRTGYQEGMEFLDMADDLITTDYTSDAIEHMVLEHLDRQAERDAVWEAGHEAVPEYSFVTKRV